MRGHVATAAVFAVFITGGARAASVEEFVAGCQASLNWNQAMCECAAKKAKAELTPRGFDFQVAAFNKNDAQTARLRSQMEIPEVMAAGTFMLRAGKGCAAGG